MAIFDMPDDRFAGAEWDLPPVQDEASSRYTGSDQVSTNPWQARWTVSAQHVTIIGEANIRPWRAFKSNLNGRENRFRFPACEMNQVSAVDLRTSGSVAAGTRTLPLDGMPASAQFLPEGAFLTIVYASGEEQLVVLRSALVANGGGAGNATIDPPTRAPLANNSFVHHVRPWGLVALDAAMPIKASAGQQYNFSISASESLRA